MDNEKIDNVRHVTPLSEAGHHVAAYPASAAAEPILANYRTVPARGIVHSHFTVEGLPPQRQLLAWRDRVGHVIDVLPSLNQIENPFRASIDRYAIGELVFTDCRSDALLLERSVARISIDTIRDYVFHVFMEGGVESDAGSYSRRRSTPSVARMIALDMNQPVRMKRHACRVLTLFVPRSIVETALPHADSIHGRVFENTTALTRLLIEHVVALAQNLAGMSANEAGSAINTSVQLLVAAFGKQAQLSGSARAAVRSAMFDKARRHIQANLQQAELSPENLLNTLQLPRATLYRLFEHEGGLGTYIRNCRLRAAADELIKSPNLAVMDVAYSLGFESASDFTRAFRRAYDVAPQDLRAQALELRRTRGQ